MNTFRRRKKFRRIFGEVGRSEKCDGRERGGAGTLRRWEMRNSESPFFSLKKYFFQ
jgi:hypothetical protein